VACKYTQNIAITKYNKLVEACRKASENEVKHLLDEGVDPNTINTIHYTAGCGSEAIV
jgi:ankyrin repeat protein